MVPASFDFWLANLDWSVEDDPAQQLARRAYVVKGDACGCG